jgi:hypothetical protein
MSPQQTLHQPFTILFADPGGGAPDASEDADDSLEEAGRDERDYVRQRLRAELQRDPTEEEINDWLRQHTEGY